MNLKTEIFDLDADRLIIDMEGCVTKNSIFNGWSRERIENVLSQHYSGQTVIIRSHDGANLLRTGVYHWVETIQDAFNISDHKIIFNTITPPINGREISDGLISRYPWQKVNLKAFLDANDAIQNHMIDKRLHDAKFVGALAMGRVTLWRLRMIYELDQAFPDDTFITHNRKPSLSMLSEDGNSQIAKSDLENEYKWLTEKRFDADPGIGTTENAVDYKKAYECYHYIWNRHQIEVIMETDEYQNEWFTDKTAKCLATGKPFVMLSGQNSLYNLRQMGFNTFNQFIDESYDQCRSPATRILHMIESLRTLYNDPNKDAIMEQMHKIAQSNIELLKNYVQSKV